MARGPKKHLKRINTPKSWLLSKMGGVYATRPSQGPHKLRECLPLSIILKYIYQHEETSSRLLLPVVKLTTFFKIRSPALKLIIKLEETLSSPLASWTSFPSLRLESTSDFSTTSREDSTLSKSRKLRPSSNC